MQKPFLDYATSYDTGTDAVTAIQPIINGEAAHQGTFRRPSENLRGRSEALRRAIDDLFYYRDRPVYVMQAAGSGKLAWNGTVGSGGTGVLDNTTQLTVSPLGGAVANTKGVIGIGTAASNRVNYTVTGSTYASDGVNRWNIEHRSIPGQASVQVHISEGPNHFILVTFDATNTAHDAIAIASAVNTAIAGNADTAGKLTATSAGVALTAGAVSGGPVSFFDGVVSATISGTPTVDVEAHTLPAGALGTLTAGTPLAEGSVILIAYRDVIEPAGGDPLDPKGGQHGGRAESNPARSNTAVTANLVVLSGAPTDGLHLSGAIPLVRIVGGVARFVDGTAISAGNEAVPGAAVGAEFDASGFSGPTTLDRNGGILTTDETLTQALGTVDQRLAQRRAVTWTVTDGSLTFGGDFNAAAGVVQAVASCASGSAVLGGTIHVRRGTYTGFATGTHSVDGVRIEGERAVTKPTLSFSAAGIVLTGNVVFRGMRLVRVGTITVEIQGSVRFEDCAIDTGLFQVVSGSSQSYCDLDGTDLVQTSVSAAPVYGLAAHVASLRVYGGRLQGPDSLVADMSGPDTRPALFSTLETTRIDLRASVVPNDSRVGWRVASIESSTADAMPLSAHIEPFGRGVYASPEARPGSAVDLTSSARLERVAGALDVQNPEPSRIVFHPVRERDLSTDPPHNNTPSVSTPELELVEIVDPRTSGAVAGYVELPASVTLADVYLGFGNHHWRAQFVSNAAATLSSMCRADVVSLEGLGYFRIYAVNRTAGNGSLVLCRLDGGRIDVAPPAGSHTLHYYRVVRGHVGGSSDSTTMDTMAFGPTDPQMGYLPVVARMVPSHQILGGLVIGADQAAGGLAVGRRRGEGIATPAGDAVNFTPDFIVDKNDGTSYARQLVTGYLTVHDGTITVDSGGVFAAGSFYRLTPVTRTIPFSPIGLVGAGLIAGAAGALRFTWNVLQGPSVQLTTDTSVYFLDLTNILRAGWRIVGINLRVIPGNVRASGSNVRMYLEHGAALATYPSCTQLGSDEDDGTMSPQTLSISALSHVVADDRAYWLRIRSGSDAASARDTVGGGTITIQQDEVW